MIIHRAGDILASTAAALVVPVNCVGVAGKGLALAFRERWPTWFAEYQYSCRRGLVHPGRTYWHGMGSRYVVDFPTKRHWRDPSQLEWIDAGLTDLQVQGAVRDVYSFAVPALGCGLGSLSWSDVLPLIEAAFAGFSGTVEVYGPKESS